MHKVLYVGLDPTRYIAANKADVLVVHCPIIQTKSNQVKLSDWSEITHVLFTSPSAVNYWHFPLEGKTIISIGLATSAALPVTSLIAPFATQEGVIALLETIDLTNAYLLWPKSSKSRPLLIEYLQKRQIRFRAIDLYETSVCSPEMLPNLADFEEIVFTSPSTVAAFVQIFGPLPSDKQLTAIGPITRKAISECCY